MTMQMLLARRRMMMQAAAPSDTYLTFTANTAGSTIAMQAVGSAPSVSLEYSTDGGVTWQTFTVGSTTITLANVGDKVKMRGTNIAFASSLSNYNKFVMTGGIAASGDLTSLLNGTGGDVALNSYAFYCIFYACSSLTSAPSLPATTLADNCYRSMFNACSSLTSAPSLPATTLADYCYSNMFRGCTSLTAAPSLPATTLEDSCYSNMFNGCTNLAYIKAMFLTTPSIGYTSTWVNGVAASGTFVKNSAATWNVTGTNGVPSGWTVETADA